MKKPIHYFLSSNSSRGFVSFLEPALRYLDTVIRLNGWPGETAELFLEEIAEEAKSKEMEIHFVHNCLDNKLTGIILPEISSAVISLPLSERSEHNVLNLLSDQNIQKANHEFMCAFEDFQKAIQIHDGWEKIYISAMNFDAADSLADDTIQKLIGQNRGTKSEGICCDRYFGAATIGGSVDYISNITADLPRRFFIKGRPGTGKSTFLKKIGAAAASQGFDVERYHCALDPNSMDLIVVRELEFCVFDSTAPHEYFPEREGDEIIDIYAAVVEPGTDEKNEEELTKIQSRYKSQVAQATSHLKNAFYALRDFSSEYFVLDPATIQQEKDMILQKIFSK